MAQAAGLGRTAARRSSRGICFVGPRDFGAFMAQYVEPVGGGRRPAPFTYLTSTVYALGPCLPCAPMRDCLVGDWEGAGNLQCPRRQQLAGHGLAWPHPPPVA